MATDQSYARLYNKKLLPLDQFDTNFLQYLRGLADESIIITTDARGAAIKTLITVTANGNNQIDVGAAGGPYKAVNGGGKVIKFASADPRNTAVKIPPDAGIVYNAALEVALVEDKTEVNPRTGVVEYRNIKEEIGRVLSPSAVTWNAGNSTLTLVLNNHFEVNKDNSGRKIRAWLKPLASGGLVGPQVAVDGPGVAAAFYEVNASFDGTNTYINIISATPLGQAATPSTTATDYLVLVKGPTVRRQALENLLNTAGACYLATITSVATGFPVAAINTGPQTVITYGVFVAAPGSGGNGVSGTGDGLGSGVVGTGGASAGVGGSFVGGAGGGPGVNGQGNGAGAQGVIGWGGSSGGIGVQGNGGASDGDGVNGFGGTTNGKGVNGLGQGTGAGVLGTGGGNSGIGVQGVGGATNGKGGSFTGTGTGIGVSGTGGATSGTGGSFTGGAPNGIGVVGNGTANGQGGTFTGGSGAAGMSAQGGATAGNGGNFTGGGTSSGGILATGGTPNGPGITGNGTGSGRGGNFTGGSTAGTAGISGTGGSGGGDGVQGTGTSGNRGGTFAGQGAGAGAQGTGGATGVGLAGIGGATSGDGVTGTGSAGNARGGTFAGQGSGAGAQGTGGATGVGLAGVGGATSGDGVTGTGTAGNANGLVGTGNGTGAGVSATGGATGPGGKFTGGGSGAGAPINLGQVGSDPSTLNNGDFWIKSTGVFSRFNGITSQLAPASFGYLGWTLASGGAGAAFTPAAASAFTTVSGATFLNQSASLGTTVTVSTGTIQVLQAGTYRVAISGDLVNVGGTVGYIFRVFKNGTTDILACKESTSASGGFSTATYVVLAANDSLVFQQAAGSQVSSNFEALCFEVLRVL